MDIVVVCWFPKMGQGERKWIEQHFEDGVNISTCISVCPVHLAEVKERLVDLWETRDFARDPVKILQIWVIRPLELLEKLHGHGELHEGGQVANIEVLNRLDVSLTQDLLSISDLFPQIL